MLIKSNCEAEKNRRIVKSGKRMTDRPELRLYPPSLQSFIQCIVNISQLLNFIKLLFKHVQYFLCNVLPIWCKKEL